MTTRQQIFEYEPDKTLGKVRRGTNAVKVGDIIFETGETNSAPIRRKVVAIAVVDNRNYLTTTRTGPTGSQEVTLQYIQREWDVEEEVHKTVEAKDLEPGMIIWVEKPQAISKPAALVITQVFQDYNIDWKRKRFIEGEFVGFPNYKHVGEYDLAEKFVVARRKGSK